MAAGKRGRRVAWYRLTVRAIDHCGRANRMTEDILWGATGAEGTQFYNPGGCIMESSNRNSGWFDKWMIHSKNRW